MKILLISPPVSNIGQAAPGISALSAWMRHLGHECEQWDLGIEAFHFFHSAQYLTQMARPADAQQAGAQPADACHDRQGVSNGIGVQTEKLADEIESAKDALRRPGIEMDLAGMARAISGIRRAGALISSAHGLCRLTYSQFEIPGALASWESLAEAVRDQHRNPMLEFFRGRVVPRITHSSPQLVGISVGYHCQLIPAFSLALALKESSSELPVLLGGAFLKAVQDDLRQMPTWVVPTDGICIGDGEPALEAYAAALEGQGPMRDVPNLLMPVNERFLPTGQWDQFGLDRAPVPMMDMAGLALDSYLVPRYAIPLPAARGCHWHRCVFCNISNQARERYRSRRASLCLADIQASIGQTGTNWFDFPTDSFLPRDLQHLATALIDAGEDVRWAAEVLLDRRLTDEVIALLARSGCCCLRFGLESACPRTLRLMDKRVELQEATRILAACRRHGIRTGVMLIVGFPTETQTELMQTVDYLREHAQYIDFLALHDFTLAPGSRLAAEPELAGIHLLPRQGVLTPSLPYDHSNPVAMRPQDIPNVIASLSDALIEHFPQNGELWASGVGGWLTFAASCSNPPEFFKQPVPEVA